MALDSFNLARFGVAQDQIYESVCAELRAGQKRGHWMWFIFPQLRGLGASEMAQRYAIGSRAEARAYHEHPLLGARLQECTRLLLGLREGSAEQILGFPDVLKLHSCLTLFAAVAPEAPVYRAALERYYGGRDDRRTLALLEQLG